MRYAIVADIHANLAAFQAVLDHIGRQGEVGELWCLGDVVGYGPDPHECLELLQQCNHVGVAGNHDWAALGKMSTSEMNPDAALACRWTSQRLNAKDTVYLSGLAEVETLGDFTLVHGSPRQPIREYLNSVGIAGDCFNYFQSRYCLVGHSHLPLVFKQEGDGTCSFKPFTPDVRLVLGKTRLIINPGSVGQPRDGDPRASYAVYDDEVGTVRLHRVAYDIGATQTRMVGHNFPIRLVARLSKGT